MARLYKQQKSIKKYLDGDIWYVFNKAGVDSKFVKSDRGGSYISDDREKKKIAKRQYQDGLISKEEYENIKNEKIENNTFIQVKVTGKDINTKKVDKEVRMKIKGYVPPSNYWG